MKTIKASEANRGFSGVLRDVARGVRYTIISRGRPVAVIEPVAAADRGQRNRARSALLARLRRQEASGRRTWSRSELYD